jgi:diguanylate cyclase (GGDEF)-like protein/PAS domain S-box-containing protein
MNPKKAAISDNSQREIATLLDVLLKTGKRLEELTSGQIDTVADPEGRMLLLRGTQEQLSHNEMAKQAAILNALPANIALLDSEGTIVSVNDGWRTFAKSVTMQFEPGQELGLDYLRVCNDAIGLSSDEAHLAAEGIRSVLNGRTSSFSIDYDCSSSAKTRWFELSATPLSSNGRKGVIVMHRDITASKLDQSKLALLAQRLSLATEVAKMGVWEWDLASNLLTWDSTMFSIYEFQQQTEISYEQWADAVYPEDLPKVEAALKRATAGGTEETVEFRIVASNGELKYVSAAEIGVFDLPGVVSRVIGVNVDITERKRAEEDLLTNRAVMTHQAEHDFLTDLPNQMVLRDRIEQAIKRASRHGQKVAVLFLDLDGFKHINDSLGHPIGDKLLQSIARRLEGAVRASDTVSRFGGDEFIVLLPETQHPQGTAISAARMLEAVSTIHSVGQHELQISTCIGISIYPDDGLDSDTLIKNADAAMYQAKGRGGSSYQFFHPDMSIRAVERQFIEQSLRRALERDELSLYYQPKVDLRSGTITGVEALLRWTHPVRGPISPVQFITIAEDCGLILPIGMWVLEEACRQARMWIDAGLPAIRIAVNVSGGQFQSEHFQARVMAILEKTSIEPEYLELEVTESLLMKNPEFTASLLQGLRRKGVKVAIDDFGTGYSSLSYLQRFPIDTLKIDQSFVRQIETVDGANIVTAIINMGRNLGMRIVAEGVETSQEVAILESMGCEVAQGYYFSRPVSSADFATLFARQIRAKEARVHASPANSDERSQLTHHRRP